jgi:hypothetical protein
MICAYLRGRLFQRALVPSEPTADVPPDHYCRYSSAQVASGDVTCIRLERGSHQLVPNGLGSTARAIIALSLILSQTPFERSATGCVNDAELTLRGR